MAAPRGERLTEALLVELLAGRTWVEAAANVGCSRGSVAARARDPEFRQRLTDARSDRLERISDTMSHLATEAVEVLAAVMRDEAAPVASRVRAAVALLRLGERHRDEAVTEARISALEAHHRQSVERGLRAVQ